MITGVITIDTKLCTGCGACLDVCPTGAIYLVDGKAVPDTALCKECEACIDACPAGAIAIDRTALPVAGSVRLPAVRPEPEVVHVAGRPRPVSLQHRLLPALGAALAWAGREVLPWLADLFLNALDRPVLRSQVNGGAPRPKAPASGGRGGGRQQRRRRRGRH